jgi:hypothetical protein
MTDGNDDGKEESNADGVNRYKELTPEIQVVFPTTLGVCVFLFLSRRSTVSCFPRAKESKVEDTTFLPVDAPLKVLALALALLCIRIPDANGDRYEASPFRARRVATPNLGFGFDSFTGVQYSVLIRLDCLEYSTSELS